MTPFQTTRTPAPDRKDHVWFRASGRWKCCLCGAVTAQPPPCPTPMAWMPARYEQLTAEERALAPELVCKGK